MDSQDLTVFKLILKMLRECPNVLECHITKKIDQVALSMFRVIIKNEPSFSSFRVYVTKSKNLCIFRVDDAGRPSYSTCTEQAIGRIGRRAGLTFTETSGRGKSLQLKTNLIDGSVEILSKVFSGDRSYIPPPMLDAASAHEQPNLPIGVCLKDIRWWLQSDSSVAIIYGAPGCGKNTQVVQYLLQECHTTSTNCRAICVYQEEVQVLATTRQISDERQETVGSTVGYKLAGGSRISDSTNVAFCTDDALILALLPVSGLQSFAELTHVIVGNVGQRTVKTDLLLSLLKEKQRFHSSLKLLLLTENMDVVELMKFFNEPYFISDPRVAHPQSHSERNLSSVDYNYLDAILTDVAQSMEIVEMRKCISMGNPLKAMAELQNRYANQNGYYVSDTLDVLLEHYWHAEHDAAFSALLTVLESNNHLVDYQHTETLLTPLMIAAAKDNANAVKTLLKLGANPYVRGKEGLVALDWCNGANKSPCWKLIVDFSRSLRDVRKRAYDQERLIVQLYHRIHNPYVVDYSLILDIVQHIILWRKYGKILVTLPDFTHVLHCYQLLRVSAFVQTNKVDFMIYHRFVTDDELACTKNFPSSPTFVVILMAGPLFEMLPSLDCIDYVVDSGLKEQKVYNPTKAAYLNRLCYNSKRTSRFLLELAKQGCYFLYTREQHDSIPPDDQPNRNCSGLPEEMLRAILCRDKSCASIESFFDSSLTAPPDRNVARSVKVLSTIGAIQRPLHQPTNLGFLLASLRIEVHLGKTILYSILFKCLDPILTIVAALRLGNPFSDPLNEEWQMNIVSSKRALSHRSYSDCLVMLRLYQQWSLSKLNLSDNELTSKYRLKKGIMDAISNVRIELMVNLRAIGIVKCGQIHNTAVLNEHADSWTRVKACLAAGFYPNLAKVDYEKKAFSDNSGTTTLKPHPLSVVNLEELPSKWVIFDHKEDFMLVVQDYNASDSVVHIVENTVISDWMVLLMCHVDDANRSIPRSGGSADDGIKELIIDKTYAFQLTSDCFKVVVSLRQQLGLLFREFTCGPLHTLERRDTARIIEDIFSILEEEEKGISLSLRGSIGTRPKITNKCPMGVLWNKGRNNVRLT